MKITVTKYACYGRYTKDDGRRVPCDQREISINQCCSKCGEFKTEVYGDVVYNGDVFFAVQGENYTECFLNIDITNGDYIINAYEGRKRVARKKGRK